MNKKLTSHIRRQLIFLNGRFTKGTKEYKYAKGYQKNFYPAENVALKNSIRTSRHTIEQIRNAFEKIDYQPDNRSSSLS